MTEGFDVLSYNVKSVQKAAQEFFDAIHGLLVANVSVEQNLSDPESRSAILTLTATARPGSEAAFDHLSINYHWYLGTPGELPRFPPLEPKKMGYLLGGMIIFRVQQLQMEAIA